MNQNTFTSMSDHFDKIKEYISELNYSIVTEDRSSGIFMIENENYGVKNVVLCVADPILIIEQFLFELKDPNEYILKDLLMKNRDIVHGAFCLDSTGEKVIFRDTLQVSTLDLNELESTLNSLALLLTEYSDQLIEYAKH